MWYIKANYCLLRLSPPQQQRSPQEKEQHLSFALGSWEGLELGRVTGKPIVSNRTMDHRFRRHCQAGSGEILLENLAFLPSSQKADLLQVHLVIEKRRKWWPVDKGGAGVLVLASTS